MSPKPWLKILAALIFCLLSACSAGLPEMTMPAGLSLTPLASTATGFSGNDLSADPTRTPPPGVTESFLPPTFSPVPSPAATEATLPTSTATHTPIPTRTVRFAVIGDYGLAGKPAKDVAALVKSWQVDLILTTGDNNYPNGSAETIDENIGQYYQQYIYPYRGNYGEGAETNRFFPALGNHDYGAPGAGPYLEYFSLPGNERYYDFIWGPVHFFAVNSDNNEPDGFRRDSIQANWLKDSLANSDAPWKIVYMHHAPYSSGAHGPVTWMQWPFAEWGASAVLSGHDHTYERIIIGGVPYFVNGLGGGPRYAMESLHPGSQVRFRDDHGAMLVEADESQIFFQFITRLGEVIDVFMLSR